MVLSTSTDPWAGPKNVTWTALPSVKQASSSRPPAAWTLKEKHRWPLKQICSRWHSHFLILLCISKKIRLGVSCESSAGLAIHMKCRLIFYKEKYQNTEKKKIKMLSGVVVISTFRVKNKPCRDKICPRRCTCAVWSESSLGRHVRNEPQRQKS